MRRPGRSRFVFAVGAAALLHVALLPLVFDTSPAETGALSFPVAAQPSSEATAEASTVIALITEDELSKHVELGLPLPSRLAPFDSDETGRTHPNPGAARDHAGDRSETRGAKLAAGERRHTERSDREDMRSEIWNQGERGAVANEAFNRQRQSPEAVTRQAERGFDSTTDQEQRARVGPDISQSGTGGPSKSTQEGVTVPRRDWSDSDPLLDSLTANEIKKGRDGRVHGKPKTAITDIGAAATDVPTRSDRAGALDSAAASQSLNPAPFEMSKSGSQGQGRGDAKSLGKTRKTGLASSTARIAKGKSAEAVRARRSNPYFRRLYRSLDRKVTYPLDLAKRLEQGLVVVRFRLDRNGAVSRIKLSKSSGFRQFDKALTGALHKLGPIGAPPAGIAGRTGQIEVILAYRFSNPLIR